MAVKVLAVTVRSGKQSCICVYVRVLINWDELFGVTRSCTLLSHDSAAILNTVTRKRETNYSVRKSDGKEFP